MDKEHLIGRPREYSQIILDKANEYLTSCQDKEIEKGTSERPIYELKVRLPSVEGLSRYLGVARSTVYKWRGEFPAFSDIIEDILSEQSEKLINEGLSGNYNSTIAKLILTKHGYSDKQETDIMSGGKPIPLLNAIFTDNSNKEDSETV